MAKRPPTLERVQKYELSRTTRRTFENDPSTFRLPRSLGITRNNRLGEQKSIALGAKQEAYKVVRKIQSDIEENTDRWEDRALAREVIRAAGDWTITQHGEIEKVERPAFLEETTIEEYLHENRSSALWDLDAFNLRVFDIEPNNLIAFMARNPTNGELRMAPDGRPFVPWESFHVKLGMVIQAILNEFGFPLGSFWVIQIIAKEDDRVMASLFNTARPTIDIVLNELNSLEFGMSEGSDIISNTYIRVIVGNPGTGAAGTIPAHLKGKRTIWSHKGDGYCAPASIIMCTASTNERKDYNKRPATLERKIQALCTQTGVEKAVWGFDDLQTAAIILGLHILVIDAYALTLIFEAGEIGETEDTTVHLILDQQQQHFMACYNPTSLDSDKAWCGKCKKLLRSKNFHTHACDKIKCWACHEGFEDSVQEKAHFKTKDWSKCDMCWRKMPTTCMENHLTWCKGACKKCPECSETFMDSSVTNVIGAITQSQHAAVCGKNHKWCRVCDNLMPEGHRCTITRTDEEYDYSKDKRTIMVFDIEAARDENGRQVPTFISVREVLKSQESEDKDTYCARLHNHLKNTPPLSFYSLEEFCNWATTQKLTDFVAHNLRGYDGILIHGYMRYTLKVKTKPIMAGLKIMTFKFGTNRMLDSLNHLASSLAELPKMLGIKIQGVEKDHFPHKINTLENQGYSGALPPFEAYEPEEQSTPIEALKAWHDEESVKYSESNPWVLKDIIAKYCHQDTLVLAMAVGEYRRLCLETTGIDPIKSTTIASFCMKVYRSKHIPIEGIPTLSQEESNFARRGLFGGRTEAFKYYAQGDIETKDICSLYPSRQFYERMPYGIPRIFKTEEDIEYIQDIWLSGIGYAEVDITPCKTVPGVAEKDFIPVLGAKSEDGKLRFDTTPKKNMVYAICEIAKAVEIGYTIDKVHEVHLYEPRDDLFKSYVSTFLKIKVEASTPPSDEEACVEEHRRLFGFELNRDKLMAPENKGMRSLAKLCLNNLWGKLGQRELPTSELCDPIAYFKLMTRYKKGEISIESIEVDKDLKNAVAVKYQEKSRKEEIVRYRNHVAIAGYVTATARLKLYEVIGDPRMSGRVLYADTDSCFYLNKEGEYQPPEGENLGEWTSEGSYTEFVSLGPKMYALRDGSKCKLRAKGFRMTNKAKQLITFDSLKACLDDHNHHIDIEYANFFKRTKCDITVEPLQKSLVYKPEGSKRRILVDSDGRQTYDLAPWETTTTPTPTRAPVPTPKVPNRRKIYIDGDE